jgi:hypothetical protein
MYCKVTYSERIGRISLDDDEAFDLASLDLYVQHLTLDPARLWAAELVIAPNVLTPWAEALRLRGFRIAGSESQGARVWMRLRKNLGDAVQGEQGSRTPDYNPDFATTAPVLDTNHFVKQMMATAPAMDYSDESVTRRAEAAQRRELAMRPSDDLEIADDSSKALAAAIIRRLERKPATAED